MSETESAKVAEVLLCYLAGQVIGFVLLILAAPWFFGALRWYANWVMG